MNAIDIDFSVLEFLDFEPTISCENDMRECDNTVAWKITIRCCGLTLLICEECYQRVINLIKKSPNRRVTCVKCKSAKLLKDTYIFDKL